VSSPSVVLGAQCVREMRLSWAFVRYDFSSTVVPAMLFVLAASRSAGQFDVATLAGAAAYFFLYVYTFAVSNQITGLEEDRLNKPDRPLPAGMTTVGGAWIRWVVGMLLFAGVGWSLGVLEWALMWQVCFCLYNFAGFARHFVTKSLIMGLGVIAQLAAAWSIVAPVSPVAWRWITGLAVVAFVFCNIQDLRDVAGDRVLRRRTMPLVYGLTRSCRALAFAFALLLPLVTHFWLFAPLPGTPFGWLLEGSATILSWVIAARLMLDQRPQALHRSYLLFTYWYCLMLFGAGLVLPGALAP